MYFVEMLATQRLRVLMKSKFNKIAGALLILAFILGTLLGVKVYNVVKAKNIYGNCYKSDAQGLYLEVRGYTQELVALEGLYYVEGFIIVFPFQTLMPQSELEGLINDGLLVEEECIYEEEGLVE